MTANSEVYRKKCASDSSLPEEAKVIMTKRKVRPSRRFHFKERPPFKAFLMIEKHTREIRLSRHVRLLLMQLVSQSSKVWSLFAPRTR
jgi:hypothetical protein